MKDIFDNSIEYLKGVGPKKAELLNSELEIFTFRDLIYYFPFRYVDRSKFTPLNQLFPDMSYVQCIGRITQIEEVGKGRGKRLIVEFADSNNSIELVWFQGIKWVLEKIKQGETYVVFGRLNFFNQKFNIPHPEIELYEDFIKQPYSAGLQPVYSSGEKLKSKFLDSRGISKLTKTLIDTHIGVIAETLPDWITNPLKLPGLKEALKNIHFPENYEQVKHAQRRLKFEEAFFFQLNMLLGKIERQTKTKGIKFEKVGKYFHDFYQDNLPFTLTKAQKKVVREIWEDCKSGHQMNRLLQGDVASGKTIIAFMTMLLATGNGYQATLMAPTEILASQHYNTIMKLSEGLGIEIELLTGSTTASKKKKIYERLSEGSVNIIIGTHALIEDIVEYQNLGLVIIDEQHRFGVAQRAKLWGKNKISPHILVMTATPIPRTLSMTVYGDLDVSVIDELPFGAKKIQTIHFFESKRLIIYKLVRDEIAKGRQVYFVFPLINESSKLELKALMKEYDAIATEFPYPKYRIGILHGQMSAKDKEFEMQKFVDGTSQIMVSTTVIEVGVDVPNATVMIIENAERFGLSQLHQLRGRIGRISHKSYCILMTKNELNQIARKRIDIMVKTIDGFKIAEVDLELRGPGNLEGTQQSGLIPFKIIDLSQDQNIIKYSRERALEILEKDPEMQSEDNYLLRKTLDNMKNNRTFWAKIS